MKHPVLPALALTMGLALPAQALDLTQMSAQERDAFRAEIRAYLLENPEVIMDAVAVLEEREAQEQAADDIELVKANAESLFDDGFSWVGGNPEGDITLVEFMDYRCGYCRRAFDEVNALLEQDGNIRFIVKELPILGEQSVLASRFAIATKQVAGDDAYKAVHDALMAFKGTVDETALKRIGTSLDLDAEAIAAAMDAPEVDQVIGANHQLAQRLQISGTPSFVLGDHMLRGYLPLDKMQEVVDELRAQ